MGLTNLSTKRERIAELARTKRGVALSSLHHVIDLEWMQEALASTPYLTTQQLRPVADLIIAK